MTERVRLDAEPKAPKKRQKLLEAPAVTVPDGRANNGAKSKYDPKSFPKTAEFLAKRGAIQSEIADCFGVTTRTLQNWISQYPEFAEAMSAGNDVFNARVERSLAEQAIGFYTDQYTWRERTEEEIKSGLERFELVPVGRKYIPPSPVATFFFLKNRMPKDWRDVQEHIVKDDRLQTPDEIMDVIQTKLRQFVSEGYLKTIDLKALPAKANGKSNGNNGHAA